MFDATLNALLSGAVICRYTNRDAYEYLEDDDHLRDANHFVGRIGKRIASPTNGGAFFLVEDGKAAAGRKAEIAALHRKMLTEIRPVLQFLDLCMDATRTDVALQPGETVNVALIVAAIDGDNKLRSDLQDLIVLLPRATGTTNRDRFDCVVKRLEQWGYLFLQNAEREIYQATGQMSVFRDVLAFFIEHTPGAEDALAVPQEQGTLF